MSGKVHFYVKAASGAGAGGEGGAVGVGDGADDGRAETVSRAAPDPLGAELPERLEQVLHHGNATPIARTNLGGGTALPGCRVPAQDDQGLSSRRFLLPA
jgi:hypothetical protein